MPAGPTSGIPVTGRDLRAALDAVLAGQAGSERAEAQHRLQHQVEAGRRAGLFRMTLPGSAREALGTERQLLSAGAISNITADCGGTLQRTASPRSPSVTRSAAGNCCLTRKRSPLDRPIESADSENPVSSGC